MQKYEFKSFLERQIATSYEGVDLIQLLKLLPPLKEGVWICGGAIRRTLLNQKIDFDIDFFFKSKEALEAYYMALVMSAGTSKVSGAPAGVKELISSCRLKLLYENKSDNNTQLTFEDTEDNGRKIIIQLISISFYENVETVLDSFDFTICQFGYDGVSLYVSDFALWDLARMRLAVHKITYPVASLRRMIKYTGQGFYACSGCLSNFLYDVLDDPEKMKAPVKYVD